MRMSQFFPQTLRDAPSEADVTSHQLLLRAGYIRQLAAGIFIYLPLAQRTLEKISTILKDEIEAIGGQELSMPVVHPAELWKESGRWYKIGAEMGRFKDKNGRDMVLAMTHEEVIADIVRREVRSYRQLPLTLYHIQTKWRDDPRPRAGLIRAREFTMKDSYSLDATWEGLDHQYRLHYQAYFNIFRRCGLDVIAVKADVGMMGGIDSHEFMYLTPIGEDTILLCDSCGYSANRQVARFSKAALAPEEMKTTQEVATPNCKTIEDLANFLEIQRAQTAKAVFLMAEIVDGDAAREQFVFAVVRGDTEVNETKLKNALKARELRPATEAEITAVGAAPGYASPVGLKNVLVIVDEIIPTSPNLVAGANREGYHLLNVNYGRDYRADIIADITAAGEGDKCPDCGQTMRAVRGVEVGNIFKLGSDYSTSMGCTFTDQDRQEKPVIMGSYGIGLGRLMACVAEEHNDDHGLIWPVSIAPFHVHLIVLRSKGQEHDTVAIAEDLYRQFSKAGIECLMDDREESPGVKFNDADLIGIPVRLTVSERALKAGGVEMKLRDSSEKTVVNLDEVIGQVKSVLDSLFRKIQSKIVQEDLPSG